MKHTPRTPRILLSGTDRGWNALNADLVHMPAGRAKAPGGKRHVESAAGEVIYGTTELIDALRPLLPRP